jgi:hypothetical protein
MTEQLPDTSAQDASKGSPFAARENKVVAEGLSPAPKTRYSLIIAISIPATLLALFFAFVYLWPEIILNRNTHTRAGFRAKNFARVKRGMTQEEVFKLLGHPLCVDFAFSFSLVLEPPPAASLKPVRVITTSIKFEQNNQYEFVLKNDFQFKPEMKFSAGDSFEDVLNAIRGTLQEGLEAHIVEIERVSNTKTLLSNSNKKLKLSEKRIKSISNFLSTEKWIYSCPSSPQRRRWTHYVVHMREGVVVAVYRHEPVISFWDDFLLWAPSHL